MPVSRRQPEAPPARLITAKRIGWTDGTVIAWRIGRADGVITVYLSLLLLVMISLIMVSLESVRIAAARTMTERYADMAAEMVMASYVQPLADRYDILAYDRGLIASEGSYFRTCLEKNAEDKVRYAGLSGSVGSVTADQVQLLHDDGWASMLAQISLAEKYALGESALTSFKGMLSQLESAEAADTEAALSGDLTAAGGQASREAVSSAASGEGETDGSGSRSQTAEDPRSGISSWLGSGILGLTMSGLDISGRTIDVSACSYHTGLSQVYYAVKNFISASGTAGALDQQTFTDKILAAAGEGETELLLDLYLMEHFSCLTKDRSDGQSSVLAYEAEYILFGKSTDRENLEAALNSLLALRTVLNIAYLYRDSGKTALLDEAALAISGAGLPALGQLIKLLLISCWAAAEGVTDCAALTHGGKVPIMKGASDWNLSWSALVSIAKNGGSPSAYSAGSSRGFSYDQYLLLLMLLKSRDTRLIRASQLMECNIRLDSHYSDFSIRNCLTAARWRGSISWGSHFWQALGKVSIDYECSYSYVDE